MTRQPHETVLTAGDGHSIHAYTYLPGGKPVGIVQILHGLGEHARRYGRFAAAANERGLAVVVHDHRGHGGHGDEAGYFAPRRGWEKLVEDALTVHEHAVAELGELPVTLLGHSMGSFIAQNFAMLHGDRLAALLLSGSAWSSRTFLMLGHLLARIVCLRHGDTYQSESLDDMGFGRLNKPFEPTRTRFDWLTSDESEVDRYLEDPLCGGPFTVGLWRDFTKGMAAVASDEALNRIPRDLPILITGGEQDSVGGEDGMGKLALHYAQTSHSRLRVRIFEGGRHEMLNETNRDEVTRDWLDWIETVAIRPRQRAQGAASSRGRSAIAGSD